MTYGKFGLIAALLMVLNVSVGISPLLASDDGSESTFWQDRAKKTAAPKKAATPKKTTSSKKVTTTPKATTKKTTTTRATTVRRAVVETAPSGVPPKGEMRLIDDEVIVRFSLSAPQSQMNAVVRRLNLTHLAVRTFKLAGITVHRYRIANGADVADVVASLEESAAVVYAQPNYIYTPAQDNKAKPGQYALARLSVAPIASKARGSGVRLAIIDSVVDVNHPEFTKAKIDAHDVSDVPNAAPDAHGTGITGIAAAGSTLSGIAPEAAIIAIAAFAKAKDGQTYGNSWTIGTALDVAAREGAQVVNMSFAGPRDPLLEDSVKGAGKRGMVLVAAAGNDGPTAAALFPAAYDDTIAVTAIDEVDGIYASANRGAYVELSAPGVNILTAAPGGAYDFISGTSLASAHISALVALLIGAEPTLTQEELTALLADTSTDLGDAGRDDVFGSGVPNAEAALAQIGK